MNIRQLKYAVTLSQTRNFSQAAELLGVSQPTLSKQIIHLENDLGLKIFDREASPLRLTPAGEYFIRTARELIYTEDQLHKTLEQFKSGENGRLVIGVTPLRSMYLMPELVKKIKLRFPNVQVVLHEVNSLQLRKDAAEGICDFAILNLPVEDATLEVTPIRKDTLVLAVPNGMVEQMSHTKPHPQGAIDLDAARNLPFVVLGQGQELRQLFDRLCTINEIHPNIAAEVVGVITAWAMARAGVGAVLLPLQFVETGNFDENLTLFPLKEDVYSRQPAIVTRRNQYISEYAAYAMELLKNM